MLEFVALEITSLTFRKQEQLLPVISKWPHSGHFEQDGTKWVLYFKKEDFDENYITTFLDQHRLMYHWKKLHFELDPKLEWNGMYQPVLINQYCYIRTPIHPISLADSKHSITIIPSIAFGMGDHITTRLMLEMMENIDFNNKMVMDIGTGTGILGIVAQKEGAQKTIATDIDLYAVENAKMNAKNNEVVIEALNIEIAELKSKVCADIILANISTHVNKMCINDYHFHLKSGGKIVISGTLSTDLPKLNRVYQAHGFEYEESIHEDGWMAVLYKKI